MKIQCGAIYANILILEATLAAFMPTMVDSFGRKVTGLRIALTPRCNLKCIYCHHEGEVKPKREIPGEMVVSVARAAADLGVRSLKFTGGEPLLRADLADLISEVDISHSVHTYARR